MIISIDAANFRNFTKINFKPSKHINFITGDNGTGKTSLLEMIYILGRGKSFRTNRLSKIIKKNSSCSNISIKLNDHHGFSNSKTSAVINSEKINFKINTENIKKSSLLIQNLPLQIITPLSHEIIERGPLVRRKFLDWGLFHVEQSYQSLFQKFSRTLKQRNKLLKNKSNDIFMWDSVFCEYAYALADFRQSYIEEINSYFISIQTALELNIESSLSYVRGWSEADDLCSQLEKNNSKDLKYGWTTIGPHKDDIKFNFHTSDKAYLSRGQQKLLILVLQIAQCLHLSEKINKDVILLIDDLTSELDHYRTTKLLDFLSNLNIQVFITAVDVPDYDFSEYDKVFHVEQLQIESLP